MPGHEDCCEICGDNGWVIVLFLYEDENGGAHHVCNDDDCIAEADENGWIFIR